MSKQSLLTSILRIMLIFTVSVILLLAVFIIIFRIAIRGDIVEVPDVIGKSFVDAAQILSKNNLETPKIEGEKYSGSIPKGYIVDQRPTPGSKVKMGRQIKVYLSKGAEAGIAPRLIGKTIPEAEMDLQMRGLELGTIVRVHTDDFPKDDLIIAHTPPPNAAVQKGTKVNLLLSLGPYYVQLTMPDLSGMRLDDATGFLKSRGLKLGGVESQFSPGIDEANIIIGQNPQPSEHIRRGILVNVIVSSVPE